DGHRLRLAGVLPVRRAVAPLGPLAVPLRRHPRHGPDLRRGSLAAGQCGRNPRTNPNDSLEARMIARTGPIRLEQVLTATLARAGAGGCPPRLADALVHAVFPGGNRARPLLSLAVARAYRGSVPRAAYRAAAAVELLHCASLVHDDLPCFDDADLRR